MPAPAPRGRSIVPICNADRSCPGDRAKEDKADEIFLELLDRFTKSNRSVSDKKSRSYAPAMFAREAEARNIGLSSKAFEAAMRRLYAANMIWNEDIGKPSRPQYRIARRT